eukprot:GDKJ01025616.1.p1 GENE.GDKJ01025616.1~~GDKJ01025616.1.p1  ORF type:complete len:134 (-),score=2.32 GDKJ01025616.1:36-389(-)
MSKPIFNIKLQHFILYILYMRNQDFKKLYPMETIKKLLKHMEKEKRMHIMCGQALYKEDFTYDEADYKTEVGKMSLCIEFLEGIIRSDYDSYMIQTDSFKIFMDNVIERAAFLCNGK